MTFYASEHVNIFFYTHDGYATNTLMIHVFRIPSVRSVDTGYMLLFGIQHSLRFHADDDYDDEKKGYGENKTENNKYIFSNFMFTFSTRHAIWIENQILYIVFIILNHLGYMDTGVLSSFVCELWYTWVGHENSSQNKRYERCAHWTIYEAWILFLLLQWMLMILFTHDFRISSLIIYY